MNFLKYSKFYFTLSSLLVVASIAALVVFGLNFGIEFTGGSAMKVTYEEQPSFQAVESELSELDLSPQVRLMQDGVVEVQLQKKKISSELEEKINDKLENLGKLKEGSKGFQYIGPSIAEELRKKSTMIVIFVLLAIILYITFAFRRISKPIPSWQYGLATIIALFHDVVIPLGVFAFLGYRYGIQVDVAVITALLTVFGYSVNDTVVIFDRVRENLVKGEGVDYGSTVNFALNQTLTRSINTSLTTLFVLLAIFFVGGTTLRYFALALIMGVVCGAYSSLFLAAPLLAWWRKRKMTS